MDHDRDRQARRTRATRNAVISLGTIGALGAAGAIGVGIASSAASTSTETTPVTSQDRDSDSGHEDRGEDDGVVPQHQTQQQPHRTRDQAPLATPGNGGSSQGSTSGS